ncbi:ABC-type transport system involved in resistance to organic solvents, auxiliary component [Candidatus Scalindua japonica]|uniref:ABC-type transport system involved in resistance to organic solvents, auxiliary component n=1 Tax=Candidatus Scalindua japonica TaxID=1284222 RepID=A0A286TWF5_9BACT|nr:ABC transporter substrate-binding protein [Candidatus Scalindua japonica]GAX60223.1 ABC-type transport system involved in resistance to organic solvents, auxiliary component [Candidatus Scalindua japonica]
MKYRKIMFVVLISTLAITVKQSFLWSGEPSVLVEEVVLNESSFDEIEDIRERKIKQWELISPSLNFEVISERVMGEYWAECLHDEKREFVELFTDHLKHAYVNKVNPLLGKKIISLKEKQINNFAKVQTILLVQSGKEISTDFYLLRKNGEWKICDMVVEGVSMVNNYRSQIINTMVNASYDELLRKIKNKQDRKFYSNERGLLVSEQSTEYVE